MGWQDIAVAAIVCGAIGFLVRRILGRRRKATSAQSFVPLSSLRKPAAKERDEGPAHH